MDERTLRVDGMACNGCEDSVESALRGLEGVDRVEADHEAGTVELLASERVSDAAVHEAVAGAGYEVVG